MDRTLESVAIRTDGAIPKNVYRRIPLEESLRLITEQEAFVSCSFFIIETIGGINVNDV